MDMATLLWQAYFRHNYFAEMASLYHLTPTYHVYSAWWDNCYLYAKSECDPIYLGM